MSDTCKKEFECGGDCWVNIAGGFSAWEVCSKHCKGTKKEQTLLDDVFNGKNGKTKEDVVKEFNLNDEETRIVMECW